MRVPMFGDNISIVLLGCNVRECLILGSHHFPLFQYLKIRNRIWFNQPELHLIRIHQHVPELLLLVLSTVFTVYWVFSITHGQIQFHRGFRFAHANVDRQAPKTGSPFGCPLTGIVVPILFPILGLLFRRNVSLYDNYLCYSTLHHGQLNLQCQSPSFHNYRHLRLHRCFLNPRFGDPESIIWSVPCKSQKSCHRPTIRGQSMINISYRFLSM